MTPDYIVDVSEADFENEVIEYSNQIPVVVDFWAEWCAPCKVLGPMLEKLAEEGQGNFRLAKVDVDQNQNLALRFGVRSIPTIKAFRDGRVVAELVGVQPETRLREFLHSLAPSTVDLTLEKAQSLLDEQGWAAAEQTFEEVLDESPYHPKAILGLAKSLIAQGRGREALDWLQSIPASREYKSAQALLPLAEALANLSVSSQPVDESSPLEIAFIQSLRLVKRGNLLAAMDGLLDILRQDKHFRQDESRRVLLSLFEILGEDNEITRQYRSELALVLF